MRSKIEQATNVVLLVACSLLSVLIGQRLFGERSNQARTVTVQDVEHQKLNVTVDNRATQGQTTARVIVIEFSDFECPFCGKYARETYPQIRNDYIDTGKLRYAFRNLPLTNHPNAIPAAKAAECAGRQGRYWEMHDKLFDNQRALSDENLVKYAGDVGLDSAKFLHCSKTDAFPELSEDHRQATQLRVESTPTFFVGVVLSDRTVLLKKRISGAQPFNVFSAAVNELADSPEVRRLGVPSPLLGWFKVRSAS